jgi:prepilin-type processing-associated H-X9-DG protein
MTIRININIYKWLNVLVYPPSSLHLIPLGLSVYANPVLDCPFDCTLAEGQLKARLISRGFGLVCTLAPQTALISRLPAERPINTSVDRSYLADLKEVESNWYMPRWTKIIISRHPSARANVAFFDLRH